MVALAGGIIVIVAAVGSGRNSFKFGPPAQTATPATSLGGGLTAATAWGVSDLSANGRIDCKHA